MSFHRGLFHLSRGRLGGKVGGFRVLALTTIGRRSGEPRTVLLNCIEREDGWFVVASHAGEPTHPAWWLNLLAEPSATVEFRRQRHLVRAHEFEGDEREQMHRRFEEIERGYRTYQERTTRRIPVVLNEKIEGSA